MQRRTSPACGCLKRRQQPKLLPCVLLYLCCCTAALAASSSSALRGDLGVGGSSLRRQLRAQAVDEAASMLLDGQGGAAVVAAATKAGTADAAAGSASRKRLLQSASDCASIVGYKTLVGVDHLGHDLGPAAYPSLRHAVGNCTANPACKGFNAANVLKSAVAPTTAVKGSCLYVKQSAECTDSNNATLAAHNKYRALHGAPALSWSDRLASEAQVWAQWLAARDCVMHHYMGGPDGENLYGMFAGSKIPAAAANCVPAVDAWYKEVGRYRFTATPYADNKASFSRIGHFTQLVWKATSQLGCGAAKSGSGRCYVVVCRYASAGNFPGDANYLANVAPRKR